jgi:outer membrane protein OmpA-like peptidoglycan-associated protein
MRKLVLTLAVAMALPAPAAAQQATRSVDDYLCTFGDECSDEEAAVAAEGETKGRARVSTTRGFSLARPKANSTASTPAAKGTPRRTPRTQTAAASRARTQAGAARTSQRRADLRLTFELGSATLTPQAREEARVFAAALKTPQLATKRFVIEGHTDSIGGRAYNIDLSLRRAQTVVDYLTSLGVDRRRLDVRGYGFDQPLDGRSAAAQENRRVEAVLAAG